MGGLASQVSPMHLKSTQPLIARVPGSWHQGPHSAHLPLRVNQDVLSQNAIGDVRVMENSYRPNIFLFCLSITSNLSSPSARTSSVPYQKAHKSQFLSPESKWPWGQAALSDLDYNVFRSQWEYWTKPVLAFSMHGHFGAFHMTFKLQAMPASEDLSYIWSLLTVFHLLSCEHHFNKAISTS